MGVNTNYTLKIDGLVLERALTHAKAKGLNLSALIESFLTHWTNEQTLEEKIKNFHISEEVKSLAGRISINDNEADYDKIKYEYFKEKYEL